MKKSLFYLLPTTLIFVFIFLFLFNPKTYSQYTLEGITLFFLNVFPSIFPFFVATKLLLAFDSLKYFEKIFYPLTKPFANEKQGAFVFLISLLCGFPVGVATACELYQNKVISKSSCINLSTLCNFAGPIFVFGTVANFFESSKIAFIIYISMILGAITNALLYLKKDSTITQKNLQLPPQKTNNNIFNDAINSSISNVLFVGATITLFYVISKGIMEFVPNVNPVLKTIILGIIEITNGAKYASLLSNKFLGVVLTTGFLSFGGICVFLQTASFWQKATLNPLKFLIKKATQGIASITYSIILCLIFGV